MFTISTRNFREKIFWLWFFVAAVSVAGQIPDRGGVPERTRSTIEIDLDDRTLLKENLSKEAKKILAPSEALEETYNDFLKLPDSGIVKLFDASCREVGITNLSPMCDHGVPGHGSYYSFREKRYFYPKLADIRFVNGRFDIAGFLINGAFVDLGDLPIEDVDQNTEGMVYLASFVPATVPAEAEKQAAEFHNGLARDKWIYLRSAVVKENSVYGFRAVAYRSKAKTLSVDPRVDILVVFKVVEVTSDTITIVWRKLRREKAPKLREK